MALSTGTKLGVYEVLSAIGAGGMGEVYKEPGDIGILAVEGDRTTDAVVSSTKTPGTASRCCAYESG